MRSVRRSLSWLGLAAVAFLIVLGASSPPPRPSGEPDAPARVSASPMETRADAARAASRPTRLDPLMVL